jgi:pimeloyl-ACP methyl ester carboxylesterase
MLKRQYSWMNEVSKDGFVAQWEAAGKHNTLNRLPRITAPTLVLVGTGDHVIRPNSSENIARLIPNAKLVKVENGSHIFPVENIGRFNKEVLGFLGSS